MPRRALRWILPCLLLFPTLRLLAGGWAVVTLDQLPDYLITGKPTTLGFAVRQHGVTLLSNLTPTVEARAGGQVTRATVRPGELPGRYLATFTLPEAAEWTITIYSGFGSSALTLLPLRAIEAGSGTPVGFDESERGRRLFVAKGCVTCHVRNDVTADGSLGIGPELTSRRYPPEYLAKFLADPAIAGPQRNGSFGMPNLSLKQVEIAALVAYLNADGRSAR